MLKTTAQRQKQSIPFHFFRSEIQVEIKFLLSAVCSAVDFFLLCAFTVVGADRERGFRPKRPITDNLCLNYALWKFDPW